MIRTGCVGIDNLLFGGVPTQAILGIFGAPDIGKTWLGLQIAARTTMSEKRGGLNEKALYLDTEGTFAVPVTTKRWLGFFENRFKGFTAKDIHFQRVRSLGKLLKFFGCEDVRLKYSEKGKVQVVMKAPLDIENSEVYKLVKKNKYGVIVVDSFTNPVKTAIPPEQQNLPARSMIASFLFNGLQQLCEDFDIAAVLVHHWSKAPMNFMDLGHPYGGDIIQYNTKWNLQVLRGTTELNKKYGAEVRRIRRLRTPTAQPDVAIVKLAKDLGYVDV